MSSPQPCIYCASGKRPHGGRGGFLRHTIVVPCPSPQVAGLNPARIAQRLAALAREIGALQVWVTHLNEHTKSPRRKKNR